VLEHSFDIAGRPVGGNASPFIIAEAGSNFDQSFDKACTLIDVAAESGADAVKFQLFRADALYPPGSEMNAIFRSVELAADWVPRLAQHAASRNILFLASAFDLDSVKTLETIGVPAHKVASSETTNIRILAAMARTGKPLLISTGMCDSADITDAVQACLGAGNRRIALLQCGAVYPLPPEQANLRVMDSLTAEYGCPVGFSDHTLGSATAVAAVARGAAVIEKHFTLDRKAKGPDHFYALEPGDLKRFVADLREAHAALGGSVKEMLPEERKYGRRDGLWAARDIVPGARLTADDVSVRRPALGMRARFRDAAIGAVARRAIAKDAPIQFEDLDL